MQSDNYFHLEGVTVFIWKGSCIEMCSLITVFTWKGSCAEMHVHVDMRDEVVKEIRFKLLDHGSNQSHQAQ